MAIGMVLAALVAVISLCWAATLSGGRAELEAEVARHRAQTLTARGDLRLGHDAMAAERARGTAALEAADNRAGALSARAEDAVAKVTSSDKRNAAALSAVARMQAQLEGMERAMEETAAREADIERREKTLRADYDAWHAQAREVQAMAAAAPAQQQVDPGAFYRAAMEDVRSREAAGSRGPGEDYSRRIAEAAEARSLEMQLLNAQIHQIRSMAELE